MKLFKKKCKFCEKKIDKKKELFREVRDPIFIRIKQKSFCCSEHADKYEKEI